MENLIQLSQQMNWPFAAAIIGVAIAIGVPIMVMRISYNERANRRMSANTEIEKARIAMSVKNGAVPAIAREVD